MFLHESESNLIDRFGKTISDFAEIYATAHSTGDPLRRLVLNDDGSKIYASDARDFLEAAKNDLFRHDTGADGSKKAAFRAGIEAYDGLFDSEARANNRFRIKAESIIGIGGLWRLHSRHDWPKTHLGLQIAYSAFDTFARTDPFVESDRIVCEVKRDKPGLDRLIALMDEFASSPDRSRPTSGEKHYGPRNNAFKKVECLRKRRDRHRPVPIFWALGPDQYDAVFLIDYRPDGVIRFNRTTHEALRLPALTVP